MTTTTQLREGPPAVTEPHHTGVSTHLWTVARTEGRRLAAHPLTFGGLFLMVVLGYVTTREVLPVLLRETVLLTATATPLSVTTFLAAHLATARPDRDGTQSLFDAYPLKPAIRTGGLLLACLWPATLGLVTALAGVAYLYAVGGIGVPNVFDLLAIPAAIATAGVGGVALGRWIPSRAAAPLAAIGMIAVQLWLSGNVVGSGGGHRSRLMLHGDWGASTWMAPELLPRAPEVHLAYVAGIAATLAGIALLHHRSWLLGTGLAVAGVLVTVVTAEALLRPIGTEQADALFRLATDPGASLVCETRDQVEYCVLPRYTPWIDRWHDTISGVVAAYPDAELPARLQVQMRVENVHGLERIIPTYATQLWERQAESAGLDPDVIYVSTDQKRGTVGDVQLYTLAVTVNKVVLDIGGLVSVDNPDSDQPYDPAFSDGPPPEALEVQCTTAGQAREIVALYLAGQASPSAERGLRHLLADRPYGFVPWAGGGMAWADRLHLHPQVNIEERTTAWSLAGATHAEELLDRPDEQVIGQVHGRWQQWTDPSTTRQQLLHEFDLEPLPTIEEAAEQEGIELSDATVRDAATVPGRPSAPCV